LELRVADDSGSEDVAVRIAAQLYADPAVVAVIGHLSSGTTLAAARVYGAGATPVVMISPSASSPDLSGISPYVFRVCPSDLQHGPHLARFALQVLGGRRASPGRCSAETRSPGSKRTARSPKASGCRPRTCRIGATSATRRSSRTTRARIRASDRTIAAQAPTMPCFCWRAPSTRPAP